MKKHFLLALVLGMFASPAFADLRAVVPNGTGSGAVLQTNGTANSNQALLNLQAGTGITLSNSSGTTTITSTGGSSLTGTVGDLLSYNGSGVAADSGTLLSNVILNTTAMVGDTTGTFGANTNLKLGNCAAFADCFGVTGTASGGSPALSVTGSDTNINLLLVPKGTGTGLINAPFNLQTTAASTSGVLTQPSPALQMTASYWNGTASTNATASLIFTPSNSSGSAGIVNLAAATGASSTASNKFRFSAVNGTVSGVNTNDTAGAVIGETYQSALFGVDNTSSNATTYYFGVKTGSPYYVGSVVPAAQGPWTYRTILDDGSGNFIVGNNVANNVEISGNTTGNAPTIQAIGSDTNVSLNLNAKGTGSLVSNAAAMSLNGVKISGTSASLNIGFGVPGTTGTYLGAYAGQNAYGGSNTMVGYQACSNAGPVSNILCLGNAVGNTTKTSGTDLILIGNGAVTVDTPNGTTSHYINIGGAIAGYNSLGTTPGLGTNVPWTATQLIQSQGENVVTYSATPTFLATYQENIITLTGNVTSFTLAAGNAGQSECLTFVQDATGGRTVAGTPANVRGFFTIGSTASKASQQCFTYSASLTAWIAQSPGVINE